MVFNVEALEVFKGDIKKYCEVKTAIKKLYILERLITFQGVQLLFWSFVYQRFFLITIYRAYENVWY